MNKENILDLLEKMTLEEKVGQLVQITGDFFNSEAKITGPMELMELDDKEIENVGSIIGVLGPDEVKKIQDIYLERNRLKIPLIFMSDIIHGTNTIFPVPLALSSAFNEDIVYKSSRMAAKEAYLQGCNLTFAPMADLAIDARWGRNMESNGEDTFLSQNLTSAYVKGFQEQNEDGTYKFISCIKHFAGYGLVKSGREYNTVDASKRILKEYHYPIYKEGIDAGAQMVMTAFNPINSIPAVGNKNLLREDLRKDMDFDKVIISDWGAINELINHKLAADKKEAAFQSINATCDIDMMSPCYQKELVNLVNDGQVDIKLIDEAVLRILNLKNSLNLFENPYGQIDKNEADEFVLSNEIKEVAKEAADQSSVLLKNNSILPFDENEKIVICGPLTNENDMMGPWSMYGDLEHIQSIKESFTSKNKHVKYIDEEVFLKDIDIIKDYDKIIYFGGEKADESGEAKSKVDINISSSQIEVIKKLKLLNKKIVFVNFSGRPVVLNDIDLYCDAILQAWFLGTMAASSLYDVLYGKVNPSGKLTMTFPRSVGQCPIDYKEYPTGRPKEKAIDSYVSKYIDCENSPLFPFGYGLNYSDIKISKIEYDKTEMTKEDKINISITLENKNNIKGTEIVQLYINDLVAQVMRPNKELKAYKRVEIDGLGKKVVNIEIEKNMLKYINAFEEEVIEEGEFDILIGLNSLELKKKTIKLTK